MAEVKEIPHFSIDSFMSDIYKNFNSCPTAPDISVFDQKNDADKKFELCIRNVPSNFNEISLKRVLCNHGAISTINKSRTTNCPYYFAECPTKNDYEAVLKGMQNNQFKIFVGPKTRSKKDDSQNNQHSLPSVPLGIHSNSNANEIDMTKRSIKGPFNKRNHPQLGQNQNKNNTKNNDNKNYGVNEKNRERPSRNQNVTIKNQIDLMKSKSLSSEGVRDSQNEKFTKDSHLVSQSNIKLGSCRTCHKPSVQVCERCDELYCSVECQVRDWPNHRFYCFKMPNLVTPKNRELIEVKNRENQPNQPNNETELNNYKNRMNNQLSLKELKIQRLRKSQQQSKIVQVSNGAIPKQNSETKINEIKEIKEIKETVKITVPLINKPEKADPFKTGQHVIITHVEQTNLVFLRSNEKLDHNNYVKILAEVAKYSHKSKTLTQLPKINDFVVAYYDGEYFRAIVLDNKDAEKIRIAYVDLGNCEHKKLSELKELPIECYSLKLYPLLVYLKNVEQVLPNEQFSNFMNDLVISSAQLKVVFQENDVINYKLVVDLYNLATNEHINKKCAELLKPVAPEITEEPFMMENITKEYLQCGENISVFILDSSLISCGMISCISITEVDELDELNKEMKKYAEENKHYYTPKFDEMCVAKLSDELDVWYRAVCCEIVGDQMPTLLFIDYGNLSPISIQNIRKYPKAFTLPCRTQEYFIAGLQHLVDDAEEGAKLEKRLQELLPLYIETVLSKVEKQGDSFLVHIPKVIETLKTEGLMKDEN